MNISNVRATVNLVIFLSPCSTIKGMQEKGKKTCYVKCYDRGSNRDNERQGCGDAASVCTVQIKLPCFHPA